MCNNMYVIICYIIYMFIEFIELPKKHTLENSLTTASVNLAEGSLIEVLRMRIDEVSIMMD